ncbi:hypothetical protein CRM22_008547 [Opisthorchis felineus]|uniref:Uncharacterized protein n=1 Tax=Opisthorchis felineus TaxID=147828 RepID=A0A4V3SDF4_OPIFE|nr:hypothetical protein CRM22_008547 [Opisthorchis felineus]
MLSSDQTSFGYAWITRQVTQTWIQLDGGIVDHYVLPSPIVTAVGAAAAATTSYAHCSVASATGAGAGTGGPTGQAGSTGSTTGSAAVQYPAAGSAQSSLVPPKRGFTVLNEYDLWSTLEAMRLRVAHLNSALSARPSPASLLDPLGLRLGFACARVRGPLDLGLLEQSLLFFTSTTPSSSSPLCDGCSEAREFDDPPNLQEKVKLLIRNWVEFYQNPWQCDPATIEAMLAQLSQIGVLPNMGTLTRFSVWPLFL